MAQYCDDFKFSENNQDHFVMGPVSNDTFQFWQGLRGPYYTPFVGEDGYLYWTNNGQLPNPEPVKIVGKDGRGITLTGQCATVAELPEDPEQGEAWAVGEEEPFECYAWFGEWIDMGLLFPAGQDGVSPAVTITQTSTGHKVKITDKTHPAGQEFDVDNGTPGAPGEDGVSPAVTITPTSTGHKVKITDKTHPAGQEFDVDNGTPGAPGQGVPAGGAAGQFLRKASAADYDAEWYSPAAGDVSYDSSLTYAAGTVGEELNSQRNTLTQLETTTAQLDQNMAYVESGNTASRPYSGGEYISWKGTLYMANGSISLGVSFSTGTGGNLADVVDGNGALCGGLNSLKNSVNNNSASETVCGTYLGSLLYRKTFHLTSVNLPNDTNVVVINDIGTTANKIRDIKCVITQGQRTLGNSSYIGIFVSNDTELNLKQTLSSSFTAADVFITIDYIK